MSLLGSLIPVRVHAVGNVWTHISLACGIRSGFFQEEVYLGV
jgi:hypothetical protein